MLQKQNVHFKKNCHEASFLVWATVTVSCESLKTETVPSVTVNSPHPSVLTPILPLENLHGNRAKERGGMLCMDGRVDGWMDGGSTGTLDTLLIKAWEVWGDTQVDFTSAFHYVYTQTDTQPHTLHVFLLDLLDTDCQNSMWTAQTERRHFTITPTSLSLQPTSPSLHCNVVIHVRPNLSFTFSLTSLLPPSIK